MQGYRILFTIIMILSSTRLLGAAAPAFDGCSDMTSTLRWTSIQAALFSTETAKPESKIEENLLKRFYQIIPTLTLTRQTANQDLLKLTQDLQNNVFLSRNPSLAIRQHWLALLLATEQSDISYAMISKKKSSERDPIDNFLLAESLFMQKKYLSAQAAYKKINPREIGLQKFVQWRLAELDLMTENITDSWQHFTVVVKKRPQKGFSRDLNEAFELDLIQFGLSRLEPTEFWTRVPQNANRERIAICILNSDKSTNLAKQGAYRQMAVLTTATDLSVDYYRRNLLQLVVIKAARKSFISLIQSGLRTALYHVNPKSLGRQSLLVDLQKATQNLLAGSQGPDQAASNRELVAALTPFTLQGPPQETLLFRQAKASLLETLGQWQEAAREYRAILAISPDQTERSQLAWTMLKAYRKATPPISESDSPLPSARLKVANGYMDACGVFASYWPHAEYEGRECENFSIKLAINQKHEALAIQKLWLFIAHYPQQSSDAIYSLLNLFDENTAVVISGCQKLLRIPELQSGQISIYLHDRLREARYEEIALIKSPRDRAASLVNFAQQERPAPLALEAITKALEITPNTDWLQKVDYLKVYIDKFPAGPMRMENYLVLAELYEENFALNEAYNLLRSARQLPWEPDQIERKNGVECRINMVEHPSEAVKSCLAVATANHRAPIELAKRLLWANDPTTLHRMVMSSTVAQLSLNANERVELLGIAYNGTESVPTFRNDIRTALYDLYVENPDSLSGDSRRMLASIAYKVAQKALPLYLNMPIYAARSDELASSIQAKHAAFNELEALYTKVLRTKDPYWGSSALADLAVASANFAATLKSVNPVEGIDAKALETQLNVPAGRWAGRSKAYAAASEKTLERFGILHQDARRLKLDMQKLKDDKVLWTDAMPEWEVARAF